MSLRNLSTLALLLLAAGCGGGAGRIATVPFAPPPAEPPVVQASWEGVVIRDGDTLRILDANGEPIAEYALPLGATLLDLESPPYHGFFGFGSEGAGTLHPWIVREDRLETGPALGAWKPHLEAVWGSGANWVEANRVERLGLEVGVFSRQGPGGARVWPGGEAKVGLIALHRGSPYLIVGGVDPASWASYELGEKGWLDSPIPLPPPATRGTWERVAAFVDGPPGGPCALTMAQTRQDFIPSEPRSSEGFYVEYYRLRLLQWKGGEWKVLQENVNGSKRRIGFPSAAWVEEESAVRVVWLHFPDAQVLRDGGEAEIWMKMVPVPKGSSPKPGRST